MKKKAAEPETITVRVLHDFISNRGLGTPEAPLRGFRGMELKMTREQYDAMLAESGNGLEIVGGA